MEAYVIEEIYADFIKDLVSDAGLGNKGEKVLPDTEENKEVTIEDFYK